MRRNGQLIRTLWLLALMGIPGGCGRPGAAPELPPAVDVAAVGKQVSAFCGDCHGIPQPRHFTRDLWLSMVSKGYELYFESKRDDLVVPPMHEVVEYYRRQAPAEFEIPVYPPPDHPPSTTFQRTVPDLGAVLEPSLAVSYIQWLSPHSDGDPQMVFSDMRGGGLYFASLGSPDTTTQLSFVNPAHLEPCDLNGDGQRDFLVADLGSFLPEDHLNGRVMWVRGNGGGFDEPATLLDGIGRVADVREGDFDGDGDHDLVVAEFGWRTTGSLFLLLNRGIRDGQLEFVRQRVDTRHGAIHVPTVDLDGDGRLDFLVLISQEHETIEAFINTGNEPGQAGVRFERRIIFEADNPAYGVSGMELVDLDRDGDVDVLLTNGDIFDTTSLRPYQGVRWLENTGSLSFVHHPITIMPGVHRALAQDFDGDGDLDIAAVSLLPEAVFTPAELSKFQSVIWLEQTAPGQFARHTLETGNCYHAALQIGDFDHDGDADLAVGNFLLERSDPSVPWMSIWLNQRINRGTISLSRP